MLMTMLDFVVEIRGSVQEEIGNSWQVVGSAELDSSCRSLPHILIVPGAVYVIPIVAGGGCAQCFHARYLAQRPHSVRKAIESPGRQMVEVNEIWLRLLCGSIVDLALADLGECSGTSHPVWEIDLSTLTVRGFQYLERYECVCAHGHRQRGIDILRGLDLASAVPPRRPVLELDLPVAALVNPACGALAPELLVSDACLPGPPVVFSASRSRVLDESALSDISWGGRGKSTVESCGVALCEGLERTSAYGRGDGEVAENAGHAAYSYSRGELCSAEDLTLHDSPISLDAEDASKSLWIRGLSLRSGKEFVIPSPVVNYLNPFHSDVVDRSASSSNGWAISDSPESAVWHGMLEIIERDAFVGVWHGGISCPRLEVPSDWLGSCLYSAHRLGYRLEVLWGSIDIPVPVVVVCAGRSPGDTRFGHGAIGAAAGTDLRTIVRKATDEVVSRLDTLEAKTLTRADDLRRVSCTRETRDQDDHSLYAGLPELRELTARFMNPRSTISVQEAVALCEPLPESLSDLVDIVGSATGTDVVSALTTSGDAELIGLSAAMVICPDLLNLRWGKASATEADNPRVERVRNVARASDLFDVHEVCRWPHPLA